MDPLAELWARRQLELLERRRLRRLVEELKATQAEVAPLIAEATARRRAAERMDGPTGFVMVQNPSH